MKKTLIVLTACLALFVARLRLLASSSLGCRLIQVQLRDCRGRRRCASIALQRDRSREGCRQSISVRLPIPCRDVLLSAHLTLACAHVAI